MNATYCIKVGVVGSSFDQSSCLALVGTEAGKSLDVLCCQSRCDKPQNSQGFKLLRSLLQREEKLNHGWME